MNTKLGKKKRTRLGLLGRDAVCIFCGGQTAASTIDHQPARALFDRKQWPEGYEFPACEPCNQKSKRHEHVLTTLVRLKAERDSLPRQEEFAKYAKAMKNNFPDLLRNLAADEKRGFVKSKGLYRRIGRAFPPELPMVAIEPDLANDAAGAVFRKIMCALHYKHTRRILPADAEITLKWATNVGLPDLMDDDNLKAFVGKLSQKPALKRNGKDASDQFDYSFDVDKDSGTSGYFIKFRDSLFAVGVVENHPGGSSL